MMNVAGLVKAIPTIVMGGDNAWKAAGPFLKPAAVEFSEKKRTMIFVANHNQKDGYLISFYSQIEKEKPELLFTLPVSRKLTKEEKELVPESLRSLLPLRKFLKSLAVAAIKNKYYLKVSFPSESEIKVIYQYKTRADIEIVDLD